MRGEEDVIVSQLYSTGRTAEGIARSSTMFYRGGDSPTVVSSKAHSLCGGTVPGWETTVTSGAGVGSHTTDTIYAVDGVKGYKVEYYRESAFPPAPEAVAALRSFCPTRARVVTATIARAAIVPPPSWRVEDLSLSYRLPPGAATLYSAPFATGGDQVILVLRQPTPDGVSADVVADIDRALNSVGKEPYKILSNRGIELCDGDGWIVDVRRIAPRRDAFETWVFHFGAPNSYVAIYRRFGSSPALPQAIKAISTLCPPK